MTVPLPSDDPSVCRAFQPTYDLGYELNCCYVCGAAREQHQPKVAGTSNQRVPAAGQPVQTPEATGVRCSCGSRLVMIAGEPWCEVSLQRYRVLHGEPRGSVAPMAPDSATS